MRSPYIDYRTPEGPIGTIALSGFGAVTSMDPLEFRLKDAMAQLHGRTTADKPMLPLYTVKHDSITRLTTSGSAPGGNRAVNHLQNLLPKINAVAFPTDPAKK